MTYDPQQPSGEEPQEPDDSSGRQQGNRGGKQQGGRQQGGRQQGGRQDRDMDRDMDRDVRGQRDDHGQRDDRGSYQQEPYRSGDRRESDPQHGSYAVGREEHKSHLGRYIALGIVGLLALGGLIGGLVASTSSSPTAAKVAPPTHVPTPAAHATTHPTVTPTPSPTSTAATHLVKMFQYVGTRNSGGFTVPTSTAAAHYIYRCPTGPGPFDAKMVNANATDTQTIATTSGSGGTATVPLHPKYPGSVYHLAVSTRCEYRIQVYSNK